MKKKNGLEDLKADPGLRKKILEYDPNDRDNVRREYLQRGPFQPRNHKFPQQKKKLEGCYGNFQLLGTMIMEVG